MLIIICVVALMGVLFYFSWSISLGVYLRSVCCNRSKKGCVALTFDDGVDEELTPKLLKLLDKYNAKATFFIIGEKARKHPHVVELIHRRGHAIGNHSMYHRGSFPMQSSGALYNEIMECSTVIESIIGERVRYFRPPFGVTNPMVGSAVRRSGLCSVGWSIRSFDTMGHPVEVVERRVVKQIKGGDIVLMHDNRECVIELTVRVLRYLERNSYRAVSVDELLKT
ncbi:MAG: polysaccharide deacetylase family protein [Rikenellaceae bacterium]